MCALFNVNSVTSPTCFKAVVVTEIGEIEQSFACEKRANEWLQSQKKYYEGRGIGVKIYKEGAPTHEFLGL